jgi:hypothetical protein
MSSKKAQRRETSRVVSFDSVLPIISETSAELVALHSDFDSLACHPPWGSTRQNHGAEPLGPVDI